MSGNMKTPYIIAIIIQLIHTGSYVVSKAAFDQGMNSCVFTFYRQAAASLLLPIALFFKRKNMPPVSSMLLLKLFFCALIGNTTCINLINMSMTLTSTAVASATTNSVPVFTFCLALLFRMEVLKLRSSSGIAKLAGMGLCVAGVCVIAFYAGHELGPVNHHHAFTHTPNLSNSPTSRLTWITGTFLMVLATILWSFWLLMQTRVLREYPNKMFVTVIQCMFSTPQCFFVALVAERDFAKWMLQLDVSLLAVIYGGVMVTGVCYYLQVWCMATKGPVFLAMSTPLLFVFIIFCSLFFLGEVVHLGSIIGGVLLVGGLYSVLWGKNKEPPITTRSNLSDGIQNENGHHHSAQVEEEAVSTSGAEQASVTEP